MEPDDPRLTAAARHALHDEEVVAAFAVDGENAEDAGRAITLIERCTTCRDLHADMVSIGSVVRAAGTAEAVGALRPAPRDYRLTASDAVRLRGGNALQRVAARFIDGVAAFGRPVGATMATFGVVGLLAGTMSLGAIGSPTSLSAEDGGGPAPAAPAATAGDAAGYAPGASPPGDRSHPQPQATDPQAEFQITGRDGALTGETGVPLLFAGSMVLLVVGSALLLAGVRKRRPALARVPRRP